MIIGGKHHSRYFPRWLTMNPIGCIHYIWRNDGWPLSEVVAMWRAAKVSPELGKPDILGHPQDVVSEFFGAAVDRRHSEATEYYCVNGCCVVIWGTRGNMGGFGPAGCSCDNLDDPRDLARGPIPPDGATS